ncbi:ABC transporter ATP-binding protein [Syntrophorhabdus aromaticivorans]|jgi:oligopeptide/dipeptide ABC transporter ATP-binding protein|uniref:ABC transporter ATP-binding protein n=1 Tax=Syntrophorhabdus aromaticivorans TaxID=328301 RepID=A0A351U1Z6_9BACT|nr:ABC transporter ATP-binding protein [Syntrophorhabdus aromaticivorans]NLW34489.1 ABC transporter ATP-binding protein [Syntrophorhabdus aromaticivorans]HBA53977.1 ABC transporter ATP-binding protein [Syntrophorhabdus aromaticivorans]
MQEGRDLLKLEGVNTSFFLDSSVIRAVDNVSFEIGKGEIFGLVGESGSGKTMTALSIMRLVPPPARIVEGKIFFEGRDLMLLPMKEMEDVRGGRIGMVFQEPMSSLNPVFRVGDQIGEILSAHTNLAKKEIRDTSLELLKRVGFDEPDRRYVQYPHQLSGGQRQRILIAIAIACNPSLVIADEPTTALDVATEGQILSLLQELVSGHRMSMLFITHNLHIIRGLGTRVGIMYAGRMVEQNRVADFFKNPLHPYSVGLLNSVVWLKGDEKRLRAIPGAVPRLSELPQGCKFHPRCPRVMAICRGEEPPMFKTGDDQWVRCYLYRD